MSGPNYFSARSCTEKKSSWSILKQTVLFIFTLLRRKPRLRAVVYFGAQARCLRPWVNGRRVSYEAHTSAVGYASEGSACLRDLPKPAEAWASRRREPLRRRQALRSMWRSHGPQPVGGLHMKSIFPVNPVRRSSTFQRERSHGALNPVFVPKGILSSSPVQAAGLSNGVNLNLMK